MKDVNSSFFISSYLLNAGRVLLLFLLLGTWVQTARAQNLDQIGQGKALTLSGGLSANQVFYGVSGIERRRDPYTYVLSANLNVDLYGMSMPFSFTYSNQESSFQQPFNQFTLNPRYKWVTAHIGYNSMTFSPYTLSGHTFAGLGLDMQPTDRLKISTLYGRLQKAVEADSLMPNQVPAFQRMGYGLKVGYTYNQHSMEVMFFRAADDSTSIRLSPESELKPEENLVFGLNLGTTLFKKVTLNTEWATSAMTRDRRAPESEPEHASLFKYMGPLYKTRTSSAFKQAFKGALAYNAGFMNLSLNYERVDPEYRTLGAYYFNNDLESISVGIATQLLKNRINLNTNIGTQRNNLADDQLSETQRLVGSVSASVAASKKLNLNLSYSTFQTYTRIRQQFEEVINQLSPYDQYDTLNFTQISESANLAVMYAISKSKEKRQNLNLNLSYQQAADKQGAQELNVGSHFYNMNSAYSLNLTPLNLSLTAAFNANVNRSSEMTSTVLGPTLAAGKTFFEKQLRSRLSISANNAYQNGERMNRIFNVRLNGSYTFKKKHNFNLSLVAVNRNTKRKEGEQAFTEYTSTLSYSYNF